MSRRQRRRSGSSSKPSRGKVSAKKNASRGLWWKVLVGVVSVIIISTVVGYYKAKEFLHSEDFRELVSGQVSNEIGSEGAFGAFTWDGLSGSTTGYKAKGEGAIQEVDVEKISLDVDLSFIKRDVFKLKNVEIDEVDCVVDLSKDFIGPKGLKVKRGFWESFLPEEVELYDAEVHDANAMIITDGSEYRVEGISAEVERVAKGSYDVTADGGKFTLPFAIIDAAYLNEANLKLRGNEVYLNDSKFTVKGSGKLELSGFVDLTNDSNVRFELGGKLSNLKCDDVFPSDWQKNLEGEVVADFTVEPHRDGLPVIQGHLEIKNGTLKALPVLDKMSAYLADPRYRTMRFQKFECDFEQHENKVTLSNLVLISKGLLEIEGEVVFEGDRLNGLFNVGLPPEKLSGIPGAETSVFLPGKNRLNWAKVRIGGSLDDIEEDLTGQLIAAARDRIIGQAFELGEGGMKQAAGAAGEAIDIIKGDKSIAEGLNSLLNGKDKAADDEEEKSTEDEGEKNEEGEGEKGLRIPIPDPGALRDILPL